MVSIENAQLIETEEEEKKWLREKKCNTRVADLTKSMSECSELCIIKCGPWALSMYAFGMAKQPLKNMTANAH